MIEGVNNKQVHRGASLLKAERRKNGDLHYKTFCLFSLCRSTIFLKITPIFRPHKNQFADLNEPQGQFRDFGAAVSVPRIKIRSLFKSFKVPRCGAL